MNTKLYQIINEQYFESCMSKRQFAEYMDVSVPWLLDFLNPKTPLRPLQPKTMGTLVTRFKIPMDVIEEYNEVAKASRK